MSIRTLSMFALLGSLALSACSAAKADDAKAQSAKPTAAEPTYQKAQTQIVASATVPGTIQARDRADLVPDISGKIIEIMVDRGDRVKAGDPLVRLDTRSAQLSEKEARANLAALRAQQKLADDTCRRSKALLDKGAITQSEWERDQASCVQARQNVAAADARLTRAGQTLEDGIVRAPFAGIISERKVSLGEWASPQGHLFTLVDDEVLRADLSLSESASIHAKVGGRVDVTPVAAPNQVVVGAITRVGVEIDPKTRGFLVEVTMPEGAKETLRAVMFVKAAMAIGERELPSVPKTALVQRGSTWRVFAVVGDKLEERVVQLGPDTADGRATIVRGLVAGDTYAVDAASATDGTAVR